MNRTYAAKRLLEHGALSESEFVEITGWPAKTAKRILQQLLDTGVATYHYQWTLAKKHWSRSKVRIYSLSLPC